MNNYKKIYNFNKILIKVISRNIKYTHVFSKQFFR